MLATIILILALIFSYYHIEMFITFETGKDRDINPLPIVIEAALGFSGVISCILWGIFYYLTH